MEPGRYLLEFDWLGRNNNVVRTAIFPFDMGNADRTNVSLTVMPRVTVSGRVRTGGHQVPKGIDVTLMPADQAVSMYTRGARGAAAVN